MSFLKQQQLQQSQQQQQQQQQQAQRDAPAARASNDKATTTATVAATSNNVHSEDRTPKTYIDPAADVVLRSNDGREFRVFSFMLRAASLRFRSELAAVPADAIPIDTDRKTLKLYLDMIHGVPMPGAFVWSMRDRFFPLVDALESPMAAERALACCAECPERDPWGMFRLGAQHSFLPLARAALWALARQDTGEFGTLGGMKFGNLDGVPASFMLGLLNAVMAGSKDRAPATWESVAARFEPVYPMDEVAVTNAAKKEQNKIRAMRQMATNPKLQKKVANTHMANNLDLSIHQVVANAQSAHGGFQMNRIPSAASASLVPFAHGQATGVVVN